MCIYDNRNRSYKRILKNQKFKSQSLGIFRNKLSEYISCTEMILRTEKKIIEYEYLVAVSHKVKSF